MDNEKKLVIDVSEVSHSDVERIMKLIRETGGYVAPKNKPWKPASCGQYFFVKTEVVCATNTHSSNFIFPKVIYKTKKEAEEAVAVMAARELLKKRSIEAGEPENEWTPTSSHWYVCWNDKEGLMYRCVSGSYDDGTIYFPSRATLIAAVEEIGKENVKKYVLGFEK